MEQNERFEITRDALLGEAVGDAFGVPVEFLSRAEVRAIHPRDMLGSDSACPVHSRWGDRIPRGSWSDDTSMTVASMDSFIRNGGRIDYPDQMTCFLRWWDEKEYCCLDYPFGLGGNISAAMERFRRGTPALKCGGKTILDNGNGALMRILPFSLYCIFNELNEDETAEISGNGSAITHGHEISRMCCFLWTEFLRSLVNGREAESDCRDSLNSAIDHIESLPCEKWFSSATLDDLRKITKKKTRELTERDIRETGYVVDTLYTAFYSLYHADDYETSILNAVGLGYDTDTAAAVTGTAAGILYGTESIPERWLNILREKDYLEKTALDFAACF